MSVVMMKLGEDGGERLRLVKRYVPIAIAATAEMARPTRS